MPDDVLLSHGETPHYHWRRAVSLLSSGWDQVVHTRYRRQAKLDNTRERKFFDSKSVQTRGVYWFVTSQRLQPLVALQPDLKSL